MRIAPRPLRSYPWHLRPFFWNQRRKYGRVLDAALLWARSPKLFLAVAALYGAIDRRRSPIEPALRSLLTVRVSQINHCPFCVDINGATLLRRGVSEDNFWHWKTGGRAISSTSASASPSTMPRRSHTPIAASTTSS